MLVLGRLTTLAGTLLTLVASGCGTTIGDAPAGSTISRSGSSPSMSGVAMPFVQNDGQLDPAASFALTQGAVSTFFTDRGLAVSMADRGGTSQRWGLHLDFLDARPVTPQGVSPDGAVVSYFHGQPDEWRTGVGTYAGLVYRDLWPGIDLRYRSTPAGLKYSFLVHPGADPSDIRLRWRGATELELEEGRLNIHTPAGSLVDDRPISFQPASGSRTPIASSYQLRGETYGFRIGDHDPSRALVIDPAIEYAGYVGGDMYDEARAIDVDGSGAAYLLGRTDSPEASFPETVGPDTSYNTNSDVFIAKIDPSGSGLIYAGYIGGDNFEIGFGVAVDSAGAAYVVGATSSDDATFPDVGGPDTSYNGNGDAFIAKVDPAGTALEYAGFIGGDQSDGAEGVAVDGSGAAYVTGQTSSDESTFPEAGGPDTSYNGSGDAFIAKVMPSGASLSYAGFIGGDASDGGNAVRVDAAGAAYIGGLTFSAEPTFPELVGPDVTFNEPGVDTFNDGDGFVAKVDPSGGSLVYAGYVGGERREDLRGLALLGGNAYLSGETQSDQASFPVVVGPDLTHNSPGIERDAFVAKVNASGSGFVYSGFIGGADNEGGRGIDVDPTGAAYLTGRTDSDQTSFPVINAPQATHGGGTDAFVTKVNPAGTGLVYSGFIGGDQFDKGYGLAVDAGGNAYIGGRTSSSAATFPEGVGPDLSYNDGGDAFVAKIATTATCKGEPVTHLGSDGKDTIIGTQGRDVVLAGEGSDTIRTRGQADIVCGGPGKDTIRGGSGGKATLTSAPGARAPGDPTYGDRLFGENGADTVVGQGGPDLANGGKGKDTVKGGGGKDKVVGGKGKDTVKGQGGTDIVTGGTGNDLCTQGGGSGEPRGCERGDG